MELDWEEPELDILLSRQSWQVKGYYPYVPLLSKSQETGLVLNGVTGWIPASVPGGIHYDLYRAGYIPHPYRDQNSISCEWVENRWWMYKTVVHKPEHTGRKLELLFKGLDYKARVYMDGCLLGNHEGMFHPAVFDVTEHFRNQEMATLEVLLEHSPDEMHQIGITSRTVTQKSRFNYKWDFSTRLVNIGIWDDIILRVRDEYALDDIRIVTDAADGKGTIDVRTVVGQVEAGQACLMQEGYELIAECYDPDGILVERQSRPVNGAGDFRFLFQLDRPLLWHPNGHGEQPLYGLELQIVRQNMSIDKRSLKTGVRRLAYAMNRNSPEGAFPYTIVINGKKIYIRGVNLPPLDLMYGNVSEGSYEWLIYCLKKAHINLVRVWGGGIIEKEVFYQLCDRYGIMVWQEFIQSSSGLDNEPSKVPSFLDLLEKSAVHAIKSRRNHVSLAVWSGGNELTSAFNKPSTLEDPNLSMLQDLVRLHDPERMFLPTSASGPVEFITKEKGISHDVHGNWKYMGQDEHYELYGEADHLFHSEFGVDGMSSVKSIRKFFSESHLAPFSMDDNLVWRHHGEWWDTYERDKSFFGEPQNLSVYSECSQWIQAEGLRFILEANQRRKFENSGSIIWQANEPWPNVSCTNLIDYFGEGKMAYYWARKAFSPLHASLDYRQLNYGIGESFAGGVYVYSNDITGPVTVTAEVLNPQGLVLHRQQFTGDIPEEEALMIGELRFKPDDSYMDIYFIRLRAETVGCVSEENVYFFTTRNRLWYEPALTLEGVVLRIHAMGSWHEQSEADGENGGFVRLVKTFEVENTGTTVALHVRPEETTNGFWMEAEGAFETIFPGESRRMTIACVRKSGGGFLEEDRPQVDPAEPAVVFSHFAANVQSGAMAMSK
ncbi:glycoside hydrolase family 2 protein [Cohnella sp. 56]|uniref:glycoside hydrolase family 2 protein n=1 Tax=Cohnella sp. 56 TaxID=3113722 RepID=UPI0030E844B7